MYLLCLGVGTDVYLPCVPCDLPSVGDGTNMYLPFLNVGTNVPCVPAMLLLT